MGCDVASILQQAAGVVLWIPLGLRKHPWMVYLSMHISMGTILLDSPQVFDPTELPSLQMIFNLPGIAGDWGSEFIDGA